MSLIYQLEAVHKCPGFTKHFQIISASLDRAGFLVGNTEKVNTCSKLKIEIE